jgi:hypothetical protein
MSNKTLDELREVMYVNSRKNRANTIDPPDVFTTMKDAFDLVYSKSEIDNLLEHIDDPIELTNGDLINLIDNSKLNVGRHYKVTNYRPSGSKYYDILLLATSPNSLNSNGLAIKSDNGPSITGINSFSIVYSIKSNKVTRLTDEYGNVADFDFKCIKVDDSDYLFSSSSISSGNTILNSTGIKFLGDCHNNIVKGCSNITIDNVSNSIIIGSSNLSLIDCDRLSVSAKNEGEVLSFSNKVSESIGNNSKGDVVEINIFDSIFI